MDCNLSSTKNLEEQVMGLTIPRKDDESWFSRIPHDLVINILSRNPTRTIARCRCVSKIWESILRGPDFTELFLSKSSPQPRLLFTFIENKSRVVFFSTPQPQNPDPNSSLVAVVDCHKSLLAQDTKGMCRPVNGLLCTDSTRHKQWKDAVPVICNPSTGQSIALPRLNKGTARTVHEFRSFGYDPIDKQFKVLSLVTVETSPRKLSAEHHILTLSNGERLWREISCSKLYAPRCDEEICINGVLYYPAAVGGCNYINYIVCFDIRTEKFSFVKAPEGLGMWIYSTVMNYKGKLCALETKVGTDYDDIIDRRRRFIELWILEDPENHMWSTKIYQIPSVWRTLVQNTDLYIAGMTSKGEFVLSPSTFSSDPLYVFFYDPEKINFTRVEIQGMERMKPGELETFIDYIEDVTLM